MALAASVAVVAVLAVRGVDPGPRQPDIATHQATAQQQRLAVSSAVPVTGAAIPAAAIVQGEGRDRPATLRRLHWNTTEPAVANRLNGYLVNHSEHLGGPIGGMHPYARIVGYDTSAQR